MGSNPPRPACRKMGTHIDLCIDGLVVALVEVEAGGEGVDAARPLLLLLLRLLLLLLFRLLLLLLLLILAVLFLLVRIILESIKCVDKEGLSKLTHDIR